MSNFGLPDPVGDFLKSSDPLYSMTYQYQEDMEELAEQEQYLLDQRRFLRDLDELQAAQQELRAAQQHHLLAASVPATAWSNQRLYERTLNRWQAKVAEAKEAGYEPPSWPTEQEALDREIAEELYWQQRDQWEYDSRE